MDIDEVHVVTDESGNLYENMVVMEQVKKMNSASDTLALGPGTYLRVKDGMYRDPRTNKVVEIPESLLLKNNSRNEGETDEEYAARGPMPENLEVFDKFKRIEIVRSCALAAQTGLCGDFGTRFTLFILDDMVPCMLKTPSTLIPLFSNKVLPHTIDAVETASRVSIALDAFCTRMAPFTEEEANAIEKGTLAPLNTPEIDITSDANLVTKFMSSPNTPNTDLLVQVAGRAYSMFVAALIEKRATQIFCKERPDEPYQIEIPCQCKEEEIPKWLSGVSDWVTERYGTDVELEMLDTNRVKIKVYTRKTPVWFSILMKNICEIAGIEPSADWIPEKLPGHFEDDVFDYVISRFTRACLMVRRVALSNEHEEKMNALWNSVDAAAPDADLSELSGKLFFEAVHYTSEVLSVYGSALWVVMSRFVCDESMSLIDEILHLGSLIGSKDAVYHEPSIARIRGVLEVGANYAKSLISATTRENSEKINKLAKSFNKFKMPESFPDVDNMIYILWLSQAKRRTDGGGEINRNFLMRAVKPFYASIITGQVKRAGREISRDLDVD